MLKSTKLYLASTRFIDSDSPEVAAFAATIDGDPGTDIQRGIRLFYAVRDRIYYDPYGASLSRVSIFAQADDF